jgi:hypothetical protein
MQMLDFGLMFSLLYAVGKGLGRHARFISPQNETGLNKAIYCFQILYVSVVQSWYIQDGILRQFNLRMHHR